MSNFVKARVSARPLQRLALWSAGGALMAAALAGTLAAAQAWPDRPIRVILPSSVGGNADIVARLLAEHMAKSLGQALVVDNRGGANGIIGTVAAAKSAPDGYTIMMGSST